MLTPLGRGLRDTLDNLLPFTVVSLAWWLSVVLVITAPAGTVALFTFADPANLGDHQRPTRAELLSIVRAELVRGWGLGIALGIPILVLMSNIRSYVYSDGWVQLLIPVWAVLLLLAVASGGVATSLYSVHSRTLRSSLRSGLLIALGRAHRLLPVIVLLWVIVAIGGLLVIPALMFVPPLVSVTFNHITADALGRAIADPLEPTAEREREEASEQRGKYSVG